jgi:hypothetical protein
MQPINATPIKCHLDVQTGQLTLAPPDDKPPPLEQGQHNGVAKEDLAVVFIDFEDTPLPTTGSALHT